MQGPVCAYHHLTAAEAACSVCGRDVCGLCLVVVNAAPFCSGCGVGRADQLPLLAGLFSLVVPGLGQVYNGQWTKALPVFLLGPLVVPWIWGVVDAVNSAQAIREGRLQAQTVPTGALVLALKVLVVPMGVLYGLAVLALVTVVAALVG